MFVEIDGISIEIIKKRIKNIILRVYPDGSVKVSAPIRTPKQVIQNYLQTKSSWIETQQQRLRLQKRPSKKEELLDNGSSIPFLGTNYLLIIKEHTGTPSFYTEGHLMHCLISPYATPLQKQTFLDFWYQEQMEALLPSLFAHWEPIIGVKSSDWVIKKMTSRWGSCNTRSKRICLNLNLIKKPQYCLEYVLVHELVHLLEPSHNQRFHALMTQFMPQWKAYKKVLEGHVESLPLFK